MEPLVASLILFAGLILVAGSMTGVAVSGTPRSLPVVNEGRLPAPSPVSLSVLCPETREVADVRLGVDAAGSPLDLTVLACEYFDDGPVTCEMACLGAPVPA